MKLQQIKARIEKLVGLKKAASLRKYIPELKNHKFKTKKDWVKALDIIIARESKSFASITDLIGIIEEKFPEITAICRNGSMIYFFVQHHFRYLNRDKFTNTQDVLFFVESSLAEIALLPNSSEGNSDFDLSLYL